MLSVFATLGVLGVATAPLKTENVILMMTDGLRWQEVFTGAEDNRLADLKDPSYKNRLGIGDYRARRSALMPFFWNGVAEKGQIYGNPFRKSYCRVINRLNFSYPGYSEILCGFVDPRINSNNKIPNPNVTVFEWLHSKPEFKGKVAAFGAWDRFGAIFNSARCGFVVCDGLNPLRSPDTTAIRALNKVRTTLPSPWEGETFDAVTFYTALEYLKQVKPKLLFLSLGETDEWGHANKYDEYLDATTRFDGFVRELWQTIQSMPQYKDKTTLILTTDHGRGEDHYWTSHGRNIPDSRATWIAAIGPDTSAKGVVSDSGVIANAQIASTIAAFLGYDYKAFQPKALGPIKSLMN